MGTWNDVLSEVTVSGSNFDIICGDAREVRYHAVFRDCYSRDVLGVIFALHFPGTVEIADLTWGKGAFWRKPLADQVIHRFDKAPRYGACYADSRKCPLLDSAVDVAVFDPPHQHARGHNTTLHQEADFGSLASQAEIHALIRDTAPELRRIARLGAVVKMTDMVEAGRFMPTHILAASALAPVLGWPEDLAILDSGVPRPVRGRVLHLRHAHSYFLVYKWKTREPRSPFAPWPVTGRSSGD